MIVAVGKTQEKEVLEFRMSDRDSFAVDEAIPDDTEDDEISRYRWM